MSYLHINWFWAIRQHCSLLFSSFQRFCTMSNLKSSSPMPNPSCRINPQTWNNLREGSVFSQTSQPQNSCAWAPSFFSVLTLKGVFGSGTWGSDNSPAQFKTLKFNQWRLSWTTYSPKPFGLALASYHFCVTSRHSDLAFCSCFCGFCMLLYIGMVKNWDL